MRTVRPRFSLLACGILVIAALPQNVLAQYQQFEGQKIAVIRFDPAEQPLDADELHRILPLKTGEALKSENVRAAISRLFATGRYSDIAVEALPYNGGVAITFLTKHRWFVGSVRNVGDIDPPPGANQLASAGNLDLGQPFTEAKLDEAMEAQKRLMAMNGLFLPKLHPVLEYDDAFQQVHVRFETDSGVRARFGPATIHGDLKMAIDRIQDALKFRRWLIRTWKPMTQTRLQQGLNNVRKLYEKEDRLEAKVSLEDVKYDAETNRATPWIHIDAGPRINVRAIGAKITDAQLRKYVPIFQERAVDDDLLAEGARNLRDYLQTTGYFDADVQFKRQKVINDKANIDYLIAPGVRHKLTSIVISGNKAFDTATIRDRMYLRTAFPLQFPHGRFSENLLSRDEDSIRSLYQQNGFRDVKVTHRIVDRSVPGSSTGVVAVYIHIDEGPQYLVGKLTVNGIETLSRAKIFSQLSMVENQSFSEYNVALDREAILNQNFKNRFAHATFEWSSNDSAERNRVDVTY